MQNIPEFEFYRKIYENEQNELKAFYVDDIDAIRPGSKGLDYVQDGTVKDSIDLLVDFSRIANAEYTFGNPTLTAQFEEIKSNSDYNQKIEYMVRELLVYGNSYTQIVRENDQVNLYTPQPDHCYADYDEYNTQRNPKYVGQKIEIEKDKKKYILNFKYYPGEIVLVATDSDSKKVNPLEVFEEQLQDKNVLVRTVDGKEEYYIETGATYPLLQLARLNKPSNQFYGKSVISNAVASKVAYINRLTMLERHSIYISANPKLQLSREGARAIQQSIEEVTKTNKGLKDFNEIDESSMSNSWSFSWLRSAVASTINKKLSFFIGGGSDEGENKYIVNNYSLEDLRLARSRAIQELRSDLKVSPALVETNLATGAKSGIAYKRLMQKTISHVENMRQAIKPHLQRIAITMLELENNEQYTELPSIEFPPVIEDEEANQRLSRLNQRLNA